MARRGLPNNDEAIRLAGFMDRRQGKWDKALQELNEANALDPRNPESVGEFAGTPFFVRRFRSWEQAFDRLIELMPDQPLLKVQKAYWLLWKNKDLTPLQLALAALPASMVDDKFALCWRLRFALDSGDWLEAKQLIERLGDSDVVLAPVLAEE